MKVFFQTQLSWLRPGVGFFSLPSSSLAACILQNYSFGRQLLAQAESSRIVPCLNSYVQVSFFGAFQVMKIQHFALHSKCSSFKSDLHASYLTMLHQLKIQSVWSEKLPSLSTKFHEGICAHQGHSSKRALQCHTQLIFHGILPRQTDR